MVCQTNSFSEKEKIFQELEDVYIILYFEQCEHFAVSSGPRCCELAQHENMALSISMKEDQYVT